MALAMSVEQALDNVTPFVCVLWIAATTYIFYLLGNTKRRMSPLVRAIVAIGGGRVAAIIIFFIVSYLLSLVFQW
jgi:nucleoside recognition membrane protein YjiH